MRHAKRGRKLGRTASHKKALLNNLATSLFTHGSIRTTYAKAKELRSMAERMITFAKRGDLHARRQVLRRIRNQVVVAKLFDEIAPTFADRNGGYTRVLKLGPRRGDSVEMCLIELVGDELRADYAERSAARDEAPAAAAGAAPEAVADEAAAEGAEAEEAEADGEEGAAQEGAEAAEEEAQDGSEKKQT